MPNARILVEYKRHHELTEGVHLFAGRIHTHVSHEEPSTYEFLGLKFHEMMTEVSRRLNQHPAAPVILHRTERTALRPIKMSESLRVMLRDDPVAAIDAMDIKVGKNVEPNVGTSRVASGYKALLTALGEEVYIEMSNGSLQDPLTGTWASLAYGPKCGWRIRGEGQTYTNWLRVSLPQLSLDGIDVSKSMEPVAAKIASCDVASVRMEDLLACDVDRFFLPHLAETENHWVAKVRLSEMYEEYKQDKKETES